MATILTANSDSVEASFAALPAWQTAMKAAIRSGWQLCEQLEIDPKSACSQVEADFPVFAPLEYVSRMARGDARDPLLRQVLSDSAELSQDGTLDPVGDLGSVRVHGLLQKYERRVLLITTGACAVHCRYCFRRHFPYSESPKGKAGWQSWLDVIGDDPSIDEVILSGGDPLTVDDARLAWFVEELNGIEHVQRLRIHSRFPVVIPQRVCESMLGWVQATRASVYFVLHFNHARELDHHVCSALRRLRAAGAVLLNQAVLLSGVNDSVDAQRELCLALVNQQVLPYYLHQLDLVQGALHFEVGDAQAQSIIEALRGQLPGYAVPKLVREVAGQPNKTPV